VQPGQAQLMAGDMTAIFAADVTLAEAQARLAEIGQWLPADGQPDLPLGRLVEENSTGPLRLGYGAWRDILLGVQFTNGPGQLISAGGITMKNVAGYDLTKFMVGQCGVFGRLVTLATRTYRRPTGAIHATYPAAVDVLQKLLPTSLRPQWAMLTAGQFMLGYIGDGEALDHYERELPSTSPESITRQPLDADIALRNTLWCGRADASVIRVSLAPCRIAEFVGAIRGTQFAADPAFGVIRLFDIPADRVTPLLPQFAARATHYDGRRLVSYNLSPEEKGLLTRLKAAFDPEGCLAPLEFAR
jgi:FAD/FMN-containing dehydrogenase